MTSFERDDAQRYGYRSCFDVPLISHGETIGFITLLNREPRPITRGDAVIGLAQMAGQAIANADLYRQLDENLRRVALVNESALEFTSDLDLRTTLLATAKRLCESVSVTRVRDHGDRGHRAEHAHARRRRRGG